METCSVGREGHSDRQRPAKSSPAQLTAGLLELIVHQRQMVNNPAFSDVVFLCNDGKRVQAQRMLLAGRSEVLRSLLSNGMAETRLSEIELHEISSRSFLSVVEFLYTGDLLDYRPENWTIACELILASRFFILPTLENIISIFMHEEIYNVAGDKTKVAALLTETVGYGLCEKKDGVLAELVTLLRSEMSDSVYLQSLSEDAFHYLLANSESDCEDGSSLSLREYNRFLKVILWWFYRSDLGSHAKENLSDFLLAERRRAMSLCDDSHNVERGATPPKDAPNLFNDLTSCQLDGSSRNTLMRLLSNINCRRIHPILLSNVVEPLNLIPVAEMLKSFRFHALQRHIGLSSEPECTWDHDESCRLLERGFVIQRAASKVGSAVLTIPVSIFAPLILCSFTVEEVCKDFVEVGFYYYSGKLGSERSKVDGKRLSDHDHALVLKFQASQVSVKGRPLGRVDWKILERTTGEKERVEFRYNSSKQTCSLSIGIRDFGVVWKNLPRRCCYAAVSFGNSSKGRVRINRRLT